MSFVPLRVHSQWSLLDGVASIDQIVDHAQALHLPAIALTDTHALYGVPDFVARCRSAKIQPIIGAEFTVDRTHSIVLLAQNMIGYANLSRLVTHLQARPDREAALARGLSINDLKQKTDGLIALSGYCNAATDEPYLRELMDLFGNNRLFSELQILDQDDVVQAHALQALVDQLNVQTIATHDIHYLSTADAKKYRVLTAMRLGQRFDDLSASTLEARDHVEDTRYDAKSTGVSNRDDTVSEPIPLPDYSFPSSEEMQSRFAEFPNALNNTQRIAELCRFEFPLGQYRFPKLDLPDNRSPREEMWSLAVKGAVDRYKVLTPEIEARLKKETDIIDALGYSPYFLVVADIVRFAREHHVPISPRGSASSSVVAYCLGIHDVDPIKHNLYFERFLSLERHDPPDIDMDLCSRRRDEVIDYVYRRYGSDHVAMVCTYATLQSRLALREVCKVFGLSESRIKELSRNLPSYWTPRAQRKAQEAQLIDSARNAVEREAIEISQQLIGTPHHLSIHPGGIVIAPDRITDLVPLQYATKGLLITQFDLKGIEKLGLIKIDLLGISALTVVADCIEFIQQRNPTFSIESSPLSDPETARTLSVAKTIGCFQIESPGMRMTVRELTARTIDDLIVALALYRPGPLKGGLKDAFVRRHLGKEAAEYLHPSLEVILSETYGVIVYQEQVLRIAHEIGGFTLGQADILRRAMSKKSEREMAQLHMEFVEGAQSMSGMTTATAEKVWDLMKVFAGYGFPKAHSAGYGAVAYRMAYLKTHYPAEFMAARLAVWGGFYSPRVYMAEARELGLIVKPPHVNHSDEAFTLDPIDRRTLWMGLGQVRELTHTTIKSIMTQRPFTSIEHFLIRAQPHHSEVINLIKVNAFEGLGDQEALLSQFDRSHWRGRHSAQLDLMESTTEVKHPERSSEAAGFASQSKDAAITLEQRAKWEQEILGYWVDVHPAQLAAQRTQKIDRVRSNDLNQHSGQEVNLIGVRLAEHRFVDQSGEAWTLIDLEDEVGTFQVLWNEATYRQYRGLLKKREPLLIRGKVRIDRQGQIVVMGSEAKAT
ncbi:MAG TPA: DNA polymerase III subunit alpha [Anaerolineae bacterium]|nr:DNA polymerase III subunit alpha [Anaerolineae bacterium]